MAKKAALLPRDTARVINGLLHLPLDTMKAIAVLDDPVKMAMADGGGGGPIEEPTPEGPVPSGEPENKIDVSEKVYGPPKSLMTSQESTEETPEEPELEVSTAQEEHSWYQPVTDFFKGVWQGAAGWWRTITGTSEYPEYEPGHEEEYIKAYTEAVQERAEELGNPARTAGEVAGGVLDPFGPISSAKEIDDIVSGFLDELDAFWVEKARNQTKTKDDPGIYLIYVDLEKIEKYIEVVPYSDPLKQWLVSTEGQIFLMLRYEEEKGK